MLLGCLLRAYSVHLNKSCPNLHQAYVGTQLVAATAPLIANSTSLISCSHRRAAAAIPLHLGLAKLIAPAILIFTGALNFPRNQMLLTQRTGRARLTWGSYHLQRWQTLQPFSTFHPLCSVVSHPPKKPVCLPYCSGVSDTCCPVTCVEHELTLQNFFGHAYPRNIVLDQTFCVSS